jgi:hypothetical protein
MDIPAEGYPFSAEAVVIWFRDRHGRDPGDAELIAILNAMAARDATPPHEGPEADAAGWVTPPSVADSTGQS